MRSILGASLLLACAAAAGCASTGSSKGSSAAQVETVALSKDDVWRKLTGYLTSHNIPMRKIQKGDGIISAASAVSLKTMTAQQKSDFAANANCGVKFSTAGGYVTGVTIFVRGSSTKTSVLVKAAFEEVKFLGVGGNFTPDQVIAKCPSTGRLEAQILSALAN